MNEMTLINNSEEWIENILIEPCNISDEAKQYLNYFKRLIKNRRLEILIERMTTNNVKQD